MSREPQREWLSGQDDGAMSEANSSVQVHLDSSSVRLVDNPLPTHHEVFSLLLPCPGV